MRISRAIALAVTLLAIHANAALYQTTYTYTGESGYIPDANTAGWSSSVSFSSGSDHQIVNVSITLNVAGRGQGGFNGDLYGYLSYGGYLVPLITRPGTGPGSFGYSDSGFNVTLANSGIYNVHLYQSAPGYSSAMINSPANVFQVDGKTLNPATLLPFDTTSHPRLDFSGFNSMNPNGTWTLFFADVSVGGLSRVDSWTLNVEAVPEPVNVALGAFGGILLAVAAIRRGRNVLHALRQARVRA